MLLKAATSSALASIGCFAYCENVGLSLQHLGITYKALLVPNDTEVISHEDRESLLEVLCCFYDFSHNEPASKGGLGDAWVKACRAQKELGQLYWPEE